MAMMIGNAGWGRLNGIRSKAGIGPAVLLIALLILGNACAHLGKKENPSKVTHQASSVRFTGYTTTVEIKGDPEAVSKYLLQPKNFLGYQQGNLRFSIKSPKVMEQAGDTIGYTITYSGIKMPMIAILAKYKPGEEIWYFFGGPRGVISDLRLYLRPFENGTKVTLKYENEDLSPGLQEVQESLNLREVMAAAFEQAVANGQKYFDPSLDPARLLKEGIRGEFYEPFYDAYLETVWIDAPPEKVFNYLNGPALKKYQVEYGASFGKVLFRKDRGPIPARMNAGGMEYEFLGFPGQSSYGAGKRGYHSTAYLVSGSGSYISKFQATVKRSGRGSELTINYEISSSRVVSNELYNLAMLETELPKTLEKFLSDLKQDLEGAK